DHPDRCWLRSRPQAQSGSGSAGRGRAGSAGGVDLKGGRALQAAEDRGEKVEVARQGPQDRATAGSEQIGHQAAGSSRDRPLFVAEQTMRKFDTTAADILADAGRALHGERWRVPLAEEFGINPETMSKFMSGRMEVPDGLLVNVDVLVRKRVKELEAI